MRLLHDTKEPPRAEWVNSGPAATTLCTGPGKLLYMAVRGFGDLRAQNQPKVCPNFGDLRVQSRKICPRLVRFWGFETDLGCFGPGDLVHGPKISRKSM